jgi:hypothetical protein
VRLNPGDRLVYRGLEIDTSLLDALLDFTARILWEFNSDSKGGIVVTPHDESSCIWMSDADILQPEDVEL